MLLISSAFMAGCATYHGFMFNPWCRSDVQPPVEEAPKYVEPKTQNKESIMNEEQFYNV